MDKLHDQLSCFISFPAGQVEDVKKFLEDPDAYAAANPVAAAPAASGGGEAKKEEKKARNKKGDPMGMRGKHHEEYIYICIYIYTHNIHMRLMIHGSQW